jgi:succinate dehydrogenase/fumarate reductase flavoprotein subunit
MYLKIINSESKSSVLLGEIINMLITAQLITDNALKREESRGTHYRDDFPTTNPLLDHIHFFNEQLEAQ